MTAALAVAARAVLYGALGAVLVLAAVAAMIWPAYGPQGLWVMAWLGVTAVVVAGCGVALEWLGRRRRKPGPQPLTGAQLEAARRLAAETLADDHLAIERSALRPRGDGDHADPA